MAEIMKKIIFLFILFLLFAFQQAFSSVHRPANVIYRSAISETIKNSESFEENDSFQNIYGEVSSEQALTSFYDVINKYLPSKSKVALICNLVVPSLKQSDAKLAIRLIPEVPLDILNFIPVYLKKESFRL